MKLREFVANSLPRVRGRKKKTQQSTAATTTITAAAVAVAATTTTPAQTAQLPPDVLNSTPHKLPKQDGNGNWFQVGETKLSLFDRLVGKDSPVKRLLGSRDRHSAYYATHGCEGVVYQTLNDSNSSCTAVVLECSSTSVEVDPSRISTHEDVCQCYDSVLPATCACGEEPILSCDHHSLNGSIAGCDGVTSLDSLSCPGSQRAPRNRSRIRTNPWLPSPRPSPYSIRSFSSPCTSSRSASPSPSPSPPPSSSDNTSPLTSPRGHVRLFPASGHSRWRRHRRHHSEVKASECTDLLPFDPVYPDHEQYYSALDSGSGEATGHVTKRDRRGHGEPYKRRKPGQDIWIGPRATESVNDLSFGSSGSSHPRSNSHHKARSKLKHRSSHPASSSESSPLFTRRTLQLSTEKKHSSAAGSHSTQSTQNNPDLDLDPDLDHWGWGCRFSSPTIGNRDSACWGSDPESESACVLLSPSDDICVLTSNIEQLAHNISSEYEDALDASFESDRAAADQSFDSLNVVLDHVVQDAEGSSQASARNRSEKNSEALSSIHQSSEGFKGVCSSVAGYRLELTDDILTSEDRHHNIQTDVKDSMTVAAAAPDDVTAAISAGFQTLHNQMSNTIDAAVQTDFADDDDDELANSDSDWFLGAGSGCVTEEEGAADEESSVGDDGDDRKLWNIPDCMQDSTDTGYSSLSRDGHVDLDDDSNDQNSDNNTIRRDNDPDRPPVLQQQAVGCCGDLAKSSPNREDIDPFGQASGNHCTYCATMSSNSWPQGRSTTRGGRVSRDESDASSRVDYFAGAGNLLTAEDADFTEFCCCDDSFSDLFDQAEGLEPVERRSVDAEKSQHRHSYYDNLVPYPYDVTRFDDVMCDGQGIVNESSLLAEAAAEEARSPAGRRRDVKLKPTTSTPAYPRTAACSHAHSYFAPSAMQAHHHLPATFLYPDHNLHSEVFHEAGCLPSPIPHHPHPHLNPSSTFSSPPSSSTSSSSFQSPQSSSGRSLRDVTASLEDKVFFLRQGKHLVNRKIREAREEEMLRQQQKLRFQRLLDIHRKQILLETLRDLRHRLESQSARLQASYSAVLDIQKRYA